MECEYCARNGWPELLYETEGPVCKLGRRDKAAGGSIGEAIGEPAAVLGSLVGRRLETAPSEGNKPSKGLLRAGEPSRAPCEVEVVGDTLSA